MNRRKYIIVISFLILCAVIVILIIGLTNKPGTEERQYHYLSKNLQDNWLSKNEIFFYTGSFFAKYNLDSHKITRLSDYLYIDGGIISPSWNQDSIIFQSSPSSGVVDFLSTSSDKLNYNPNTPHWWKYDFNQKKLFLLSPNKFDNCTSLEEINGEYLCLSEEENNGKNLLTLYNLPRNQKNVLVKSGETINGLSIQNNQLYYITSNLKGEQSLHSIVGKRSEVIYKSSGLIRTFQAKDSSHIAIVSSDLINDNGKGSADSTRGKLTNQKITLLENKKVIYQETYNKPNSYSYKDVVGAIYISFSDSSIYKADFDKKTIKNTFLPSKEAQDNTNYVFSYKNQLFLIDLNNALFSSKKYKKPELYRDEQNFDVNNDNDINALFWIGPSQEGARGVKLHDSSISFNTYAEQLDTLLKNEYFEPSEFNLFWIPDEGVSISSYPNFSLEN